MIKHSKMLAQGKKSREYRYQPLNKVYGSKLAEGISTSSSTTIAQENSSKVRHFRLHILWLAIIISITSLLGLLIIVYFLHSGVSSIFPPLAGPKTDSAAPAPKVILSHCGDSPEEARANGCKFEVHNFAWVPPECFDDELVAEWDEDPSWTFSRTRTSNPVSNPPDLYTREEGNSGDLESAILPWRQHVAHCAVVVRKYQRAVILDRPMDNWTSSATHMTHCARNFLEWDMDPWDYNSVLHLKFPVCDYSWKDKTSIGMGMSGGHHKP